MSTKIERRTDLKTGPGKGRVYSEDAECSVEGCVARPRSEACVLAILVPLEGDTATVLQRGSLRPIYARKVDKRVVGVRANNGHCAGVLQSCTSGRVAAQGTRTRRSTIRSTLIPRLREIQQI